MEVAVDVAGVEEVLVEMLVGEEDEESEAGVAYLVGVPGVNVGEDLGSIAIEWLKMKSTELFVYRLERMLTISQITRLRNRGWQ